MRILITGGAGYVGSALASRYVSLGHDVVVWDRLDHGGEGLIHLIGHPRFSIIASDILEDDAPKGIDAVLHLAAIVGEPACLAAGEEETLRSNVQAATHIASVYGGCVPLVFFSTCSNYGVSGPRPVAEGAFLRPTGLYSRSKIQAEEIVRDHGGVVLRFATICGPSPRPRFDLLINDIAKRAITREPIKVYAPNSWRPFIHIRDVADAALLATSFSYDGTYNVIGKNYTKRAIYKVARRVFPGAKITLNKTEDADPRSYIVNGKLFAEHTGFKAQYGIVEAMHEVARQVEIMPELGRRVYRNVA